MGPAEPSRGLPPTRDRVNISWAQGTGSAGSGKEASNPLGPDCVWRDAPVLAQSEGVCQQSRPSVTGSQSVGKSPPPPSRRGHRLALHAPAFRLGCCPNLDNDSHQRCTTHAPGTETAYGQTGPKWVGFPLVALGRDT